MFRGRPSPSGAPYFHTRRRQLSPVGTGNATASHFHQHFSFFPPTVSGSPPEGLPLSEQMPQKRGNAFNLAMDSFPFYRGYNLFLTQCMTERRKSCHRDTQGGSGRDLLPQGYSKLRQWQKTVKEKTERRKEKKTKTCKSEGIMKGRKPYMVRGVDLVEGDQEACEKK